MTVDEALEKTLSPYIKQSEIWPVLDVLAAEVRRLLDVKTCEWTQDCDDSELYETECGHVFQFIDGSPDDNEFKNCPFCGGLLSVSEDETNEH